jgi:hypothetical protein
MSHTPITIRSIPEGIRVTFSELWYDEHAYSTVITTFPVTLYSYADEQTLLVEYSGCMLYRQDPDKIEYRIY